MMAFADPPPALDFAPGDATGLAIPAHEEALRAAGAAFLTEAFRAFGAISPTNRVVAVTRFEPFAGGNSGHKLQLSVEYAQAEPGLQRDLFVKFSRDFQDVFRDRRRQELEAEVRLATLSRLPAFPVHVPKAYFADHHRESGTGVLITERIAFGQDGVEPLRRKCMDHELPDAIDHYRATVQALARLAAAQKAGRLSPQVEALFPFDPKAAAAENPIPWDVGGLRERVAAYAAFAQRCPQLLPADLTEPAFIARLEAEAVRFLRHEAVVKRFLNANPDLVALCHWNTNIDNAWFWRDGAGVMQCGLLDWGMVRQMNLAYGIWGGFCGAEPRIWNAHIGELLGLYVETLAAHGGPVIAAFELKLHLDMVVAMLGLSLLMDFPALAVARLPQIVEAKDVLDPILFRDEVVRGFLHVFTAFLNVWRHNDFGASLEQVLARMGEATP
jgi:hypothetical protein